jgi:hypothetical protein
MKAVRYTQTFINIMPHRPLRQPIPWPGSSAEPEANDQGCPPGGPGRGTNPGDSSHRKALLVKAFRDMFAFVRVNANMGVRMPQAVRCGNRRRRWEAIGPVFDGGVAAGWAEATCGGPVDAEAGAQGAQHRAAGANHCSTRVRGFRHELRSRMLLGPARGYVAWTAEKSPRAGGRATQALVRGSLDTIAPFGFSVGHSKAPSTACGGMAPRSRGALLPHYPRRRSSSLPGRGK